MAVRDIRLDPATGDLDLSGGGALAAGLEAIAQEIRIRVHTFAGEYFLDSDRGLPWLSWNERKWSVQVVQEAKLLLRAEILAVAGVAGIVDPGIQIVKVGSSVTITVTVTTDLGVQLTVSVSEAVQ